MFLRFTYYIYHCFLLSFVLPWLRFGCRIGPPASAIFPSSSAVDAARVLRSVRKYCPGKSSRRGRRGRRGRRSTVVCTLPQCRTAAAAAAATARRRRGRGRSRRRAWRRGGNHRSLRRALLYRTAVISPLRPPYETPRLV